MAPTPQRKRGRAQPASWRLRGGRAGWGGLGINSLCVIIHDLDHKHMYRHAARP